MSKKKRHVLKIYSQEISLFSSESEDYMKEIALHVDTKMRDFANDISKISFTHLSLLTSLSLADEYFKLKESMFDLEYRNQELEAEHERITNELRTLEISKRERELKVQELEKKLKNMDFTDSKAYSKENLRKKLNTLSYELKKPLEERNYDKTLKESYDIIKKNFE